MVTGRGRDQARTDGKFVTAWKAGSPEDEVRGDSCPRAAMGPAAAGCIA